MKKCKLPNIMGLSFFFACFLPTFVTSESEIALIYLKKFGYIPKTTKRTDDDAPNQSPGIGSDDPIGDGNIGKRLNLTEAVKTFQKFAGLEATGELDDATLKLMGTPRCGVEDIVPASGGNSSKYLAQGSRWEKTRLSYRVTRYSQKMSQADVDADVRRAFSFWSTATRMTFFNKNSGVVDIKVGFFNFEHGDGDPFDGQGGTLAHAYFPRYGGDVHMDDSEKWTKNSYQGTNFLQTLTHEIGHSLGLSHSRVSASVMAPFYRGWEPGFKLHQDDILGIQSLYGKLPISTSPPIVFPTKTTTRRPDLPIWPFKNSSCPDFDTNTQGREGVQRIDSVNSWSECSLSCAKDRMCKYWTWHHEKAAGYEFLCVLMSGFSVKANDPNTISGSPDCACPMVGINTQSRQGSNMIGLESSWQNCAQKCSQSGKCSHWTWHPNSAGAFARRCVHMTGYGNLAEDENTVSGSKSCV